MCIIFGTLIYLQTILRVRFYLPTNESFEANCQLCRISELNWIIIDIFNDVFFYFIKAIGGIKCSWSSQTLQTVTSCPENTDERKVRDRKKNCESIARKQNCTKPEKFKYHCVMNALENALIEVCAPEHRIYGMCLSHTKTEI